MNPNNVIGIDFGNWNAYVCIAMGMDPTTRMGGHIEDLIPVKYQKYGSVGIPNEFFWNDTGEKLGFLAVKDKNRPEENHLRLLKKHLGETVTLYSDAAKTKSQTFRYDDIIVKMFEYHVGLANETLRTNHGEAQTTNRISLCFPAKLRDPSALGYFVSLAERANSGATDEHGRPLKIKVVGTVCEPAAAGLDRLNENQDQVKKKALTYGVFDLGGGTFDLSIVTLFPQAQPFPNGDPYYYKLECEGEGLNIGGSNFSESLRHVMVQNAERVMSSKVTPADMRIINNNVERVKMELSEDTQTSFMIDRGIDTYEITVTRQEFEDAISADVARIMGYTKTFFENNKHCAPNEIIMTGGSSYIPMIQRRLEETLPAYANENEKKIHLHRPSKGAAYGAARFHANKVEEAAAPAPHNDENNNGANYYTPVLRTVERDITTRIHSKILNRVSMYTLIKRGTALPCDSGEVTFHTLGETTRTEYNIYSAIFETPNPKEYLLDYKLLQKFDLQYPHTVPKNTNTSCRLTIDHLGVARLDAWLDNNRAIAISGTFRIDNKSDDSTK